MTKKIINTFLIGILIVGSSSPAFAAKGFTQDLLDARAAHQQCLTDKNQLDVGKNQEIQNWHAHYANVVAGKDQTINELNNKFDQEIEQLKQDIVNANAAMDIKIAQINELNQKLAEAEKSTNEKSGKINQLKQEIISVKNLLDKKKYETQVLKNSHNQQIIEKEEQIQNALYEKEELSNRYQKLQEMLLLAGVDINNLDVQALIYVAGQGDMESVKSLLKAGVDPKGKESQALIEAAGEGHFEIVKLLLDSGADPRAQHSQALLSAYWNGHIQISSFLYDSGANSVLVSRLQKLSKYFKEKLPEE